MMQEVEFRFRRGTAALWLQRNPVLEDGEPGYERDTNLMKIGDGFTRWADLPYVSTSTGEVSSPELAAHIASPTPHPAYDDGPSFVLAYENAKV